MDPFLDPEAMAAAQNEQGYQMPEELNPLFQNAVASPPGNEDMNDILSQLIRLGPEYEPMRQQLMQQGLGEYQADIGQGLQQGIPEMLSQAQSAQQTGGGTGYDDMQSQMRVLLSMMQGY